MSQAVNRYRADLREIHFVLFEQLGLGEILGKDRYADWGRDEVAMVLDEAYRYAREVVGPLNSVGDREGCKLVDGQVHVPAGFHDAWKKLYEQGWKSISISPEHGGQGAPRVLAAVLEELMSGANVAFNMYPGLTFGAAELLDQHGTPEQRKKYASRLFRGQWAGTMCLSEPQAGSDVGMGKTSAVKQPDGTFKIRGTKCWISAGDHDLADNIVHLVLARIEGAPAGTKGLSLFIVPKYRVNADGSRGGTNDVKTTAIEHKMGLNGSATATLELGEDDGCIGELVGNAEHQGIRQMFMMMNFARIGVGLQGLGIASGAYLAALEYARERKQGASMKEWKNPTAPRVAIVEHADVRRMLLDMKSRVEGIRALVYKLAMHQDRATLLEGKDDAAAAYHKGQVELMTPLVKAYSSDQAFRVCETAIQVFGGAGYVKDHPVEQYCRDSKVFSIYEGTNHIQALDLVARKLGQAGGKHLQEFLGDVAKFIKRNKEHPVLGPSVANLAAAHEAMAGTAMQMLMWYQAGQMERVPLVANRVLEMMSELVIGWLLLDGAVIALEAEGKLAATHPDRAFYEGKKHAAIYFAQNVLPDVVHAAKVVASGDKSALDVATESFATV